MSGERAPELEIHSTVFADLQARAVRYRVRDVREPWETEICALERSLKIPMGQIPVHLAELPRDEILVVVCHKIADFPRF